MQDGILQFEPNTASSARAESVPMPRRALDWTRRVWRSAATAGAMALILLLGWHVVNGKNGIMVWRQKRVEDLQLRKQIDALQQENAGLKNRIQQLQSDPDAIGQEAREELHYAKPNEVIVTLPAPPPTQPASAGR